MSQIIATRHRATPVPSRAATSTTTRVLLACGLVAGPLFAIVGIAQMLTRPGFNILRHPLSVLSNGDLGWVQITNFEIAGLLYVGFAVGTWRLLHPGRAGTWGPLLLGIFGLGMIGAGIFVLDPGLGFPPGTPQAAPQSLSWHGGLHLLTSSIAFASLIAACFVFARRFAGLQQTGWAGYSVATGVYFLVGILGSLLSGGQPLFLVNFGISVLLALTWATALAARLTRELRERLA